MSLRPDSSSSHSLRKTSQKVQLFAKQRRSSAKLSEHDMRNKKRVSTVTPRSSRLLSKLNLPKRSTVEIGDKKARPGAIEALITAIRCFPENEGLLRECCDTLAAYSPSRLAEWESVRSDAVTVLVSALTTFSSKADIQLIVLNALVHLVTMEEESPAIICNLLVAQKSVEACLQAMTNFPENTDIQVVALKLIGFAALSDKEAEEICATGALDKTMHVMNAFQENEDIQCNGCLVLGNLTVVDSVAKDADQKGATRLILAAVKKNKENIDLQDSGCRALGSFAMNRELCLKLVREGAIDLVLELMKSNMDNGKIQECGCWALACLSSHGEAAKEILEKGGLQRIIGCMDTGYLSSTVQEYGCRILVNFCTPGMEESIVREDVANVLVLALDTYENNEEVVEQGTFALSKILIEREDLKKQFTESGGVKLLVTSVTSFPGNEMLLENCMFVFGALSASDEVRSEVMSSEVTQALVKSLKSEVAKCNPMVQCLGFNTVANLVTEDMKYKEMVLEEGILQIILSAMRTSDDSELLECACRCVACVSFGDRSQISSTSPDVISLVVSAMNKHTECEDLQMAALQVLLSCAPSEEEKVDMQQLKQILAVLKKALVHYSDHEEMHILALEVLSGYAFMQNVQVLMVEGGLVQVLVKGMNVFSSSVDIQEFGCHILGLLCMEGSLCSDLIDAEVPGVLEAAMETCQSSLQLQITCCGAFTCFVSECGMKAIAVLAKGRCIQLVVDAIERFSNELDVVLAGLFTIKGLLQNETIKTYLGRQDVCLILKNALKNFSAEEEVQTEGFAILREITQK